MAPVESCGYWQAGTERGTKKGALRTGEFADGRRQRRHIDWNDGEEAKNGPNQGKSCCQELDMLRGTAARKHLAGFTVTLGTDSIPWNLGERALGSRAM